MALICVCAIREKALNTARYFLFSITKTEIDFFFSISLLSYSSCFFFSHYLVQLKLTVKCTPINAGQQSI